jgi:hypothetical protein
MNNKNDLFGENIHIYSRKEALADGEQIGVSRVAQEAGIKFPVFLTRSVYSQFVALAAQAKTNRLRNMLTALKSAIQASRGRTDRVRFAFYVRDEESRPQLVSLLAVCAPLDYDNPRPSITVMLPDED